MQFLKLIYPKTGHFIGITLSFDFVETFFATQNTQSCPNTLFLRPIFHLVPLMRIQLGK